MSTLPGAESWRDAGLVGPEPDEVVELEDYDPEPDPGLAGKEASEADVADQLVEVRDDEREDYP